MRLKEILIERYGPIWSDKILKLSSFTLVWGENEDGKTLMIEALLKMLLQKGFRSLKFPSRVEEDPAGRVKVEIETREEKIFPNKGRTSVVDYLDISPELFRNLFVITNSDLVLANEARFYIEVTERLTGLRKRRIEVLKEKLREIGMLTPRNDFEDSKRSGKFKSRLLEAEKLIDEIDKDVQFIRQNGYDKLEEKLMNLVSREGELNEKLLLLERAKRINEFDKYRNLIGELVKLVEAKKNYENFSEEELERLRGLYRDVERLKRDIARDSERLKRVAEEKHITERDKLEKDARYRVISSKHERLEKELGEEIREYEKKNARVKGNTFLKQGLRYSIPILAIITVILGIGSFVEGITVFIWGTLCGMVLVLLLMAVYLFMVVLPMGALERKRVKLLDVAGSIGVAHDSVDNVKRDMAAIDENLRELENILRELEVKIGVLEGQRKKLEEEIANKDRDLTERQRAIDKILASRGVGSTEEYKNKLDVKKEINSKIEGMISLLVDRFGKGEESTEEAPLESLIGFWRREIEKLGTGIGKDEENVLPKINYSDSLYHDVRGELEKLRELISETQNRLVIYHNKLSNYDNRVEYVLTPEGKDFNIRSLRDLFEAKEKIEIFIEEARKRKKYVLQAINILEEIESEEEEKIKDLFREKHGRGHGVSEYFREITEGLYMDVSYEPENKRIVVERKDGRTLTPDKLSGGAFDQLYFAIRLAFGEKIFPERRGFFILDDPFLKSDRKRLVRQIDLLVDLTKKGWQIIYFSAKEEIKRLFEERRKMNNFISIVEPLKVDYKV